MKYIYSIILLLCLSLPAYGQWLGTSRTEVLADCEAYDIVVERVNDSTIVFTDGYWIWYYGFDSLDLCIMVATIVEPEEYESILSNLIFQDSFVQISANEYYNEYNETLFVSSKKNLMIVFDTNFLNK